MFLMGLVLRSTRVCAHWLSTFLLVLIILASNESRADVKLVEFPGIDTREYVSVDKIRGRLATPDQISGPTPAVIILHGSGGIDSRGIFYSNALNAIGIATLEIDMFKTETRDGEDSVHMISYPYAALRYLASLSNIDAKKIGVMGFSFGANLSLNTATTKAAKTLGGGQRFAAHIPLYGPCYTYLYYGEREARLTAYHSFTGAPIVLLRAELDDHDIENGCEKFLDLLSPKDRKNFTLITYKGATHMWDKLTLPESGSKYFSSTAFGGVGGNVNIKPDQDISIKSRHKVLSIFAKVFDMPEPQINSFLGPRNQRDWLRTQMRYDQNYDGIISKDESNDGDSKVFASLDVNRDGNINEQEWGSRSNEMMGRLLKQDKNNDGKITRDELKGREKIFDRLDVNSDGVITSDEMKTFSKRIEMASARRSGSGPRVSGPGGRQGPPQPDMMLRAMDADQDNRVSKSEFRGPPQRFTMIDANQDGFLTLEEITSVLS